MSGEFENGAYADQSSNPQHRQRSGLPWVVSGKFEYGVYRDQSSYPHKTEVWPNLECLVSLIMG